VPVEARWNEALPALRMSMTPVPVVDAAPVTVEAAAAVSVPVTSGMLPADDARLTGIGLAADSSASVAVPIPTSSPTICVSTPARSFVR
jgi:hypothetical protein